jgi:hypothetical protein
MSNVIIDEVNFSRENEIVKVFIEEAIEIDYMIVLILVEVKRLEGVDRVIEGN